jgi:hypothetical protein
MFLSTFRASDLALFVFRKSQDKLKGLLAILAIEFITGHKHLPTRTEIEFSPNHYAGGKLVSRRRALAEA